MRHDTIRKTTIIICMLLAMLLSGCGIVPPQEQTAPRPVIDLEAEDLAGRRIGVMTGSPQDKTVEAAVEDPEILYFENNPDEALALDRGRIDSFICVDEIFRYMQPEHPKLAETDFVYATYRAGVIFRKDRKGEVLQKQMNGYLEEITASGEMQRLREHWFSAGEKEPVELPQEGENGVLSGAVTSSIPPYCYLLDGGRAGFDVALLKGFCERYGYGIRLDEANYAGMVTGTVSSRYDICISIIAWTKERAESVLFSDIYLEYNMIAVVRADDWTGRETAAPDTPADPGGKPADGSGDRQPGDGGNGWSAIVRSFERTFLDENRWKIILNGLVTTLIISACGFLLANALGAMFCGMALSGKKALRTAAEIYSSVMQGTPMVAILMILYYVIFGDSSLPGAVIAILGFGIVSGAYLAQIFTGGIGGVDPGQKEAALALGLTKPQVFAGIVLPQAVRRMLPGYCSQLISLIKGTSIVGYIAVVDLTKAGDIIRSTTFEAFFPILTSAVIYFFISTLLLSGMRRIQRRLEPGRDTDGLNGSCNS